MAKQGTATLEEHDEALEQRFGIELPYTITLRLRGVTPFLFNRMDIEAYDRESGPGEKRKPRTRPEYESMIWRMNGAKSNLGIPTQNVIGSIVSGGKFFKSPIGGNGSATPTLREALIPAAEMADFGVAEWDVIDFRQARHGDRKGTPKPTYRPRLEIGWLLKAEIGVVLPELYGPAKLLEIASRSGSVMGVGDGRKIGFGRYVLDGHEVADGLPW